MTLKETLAKLKSLGNEKLRAHNKKYGAGDQQFGVQLGDIRKLAAKIKAKSPGTPQMQEIAHAIQSGAMAFLRNEYAIIMIFYVPVVCALLWYFIDLPEYLKLKDRPADFQQFTLDSFKANWWGWISTVALSQARTLSFLCGAFSSALSGFVGMRVATKAAVRTTEAAKTSLNDALRIAFSSGTVMGLTVVGLGCMFLTALFVWKGHDMALLDEIGRAHV